MIKASIQQTARLIETIQNVSPEEYKENKYELDILVQHMRFVIQKLEKGKKKVYQKGDRQV